MLLTIRWQFDRKSTHVHYSTILFHSCHCPFFTQLACWNSFLRFFFLLTDLMKRNRRNLKNCINCEVFFISHFDCALFGALLQAFVKFFFWYLLAHCRIVFVAFLFTMFYKSFDWDRSCWVKGAYKFLKLLVTRLLPVDSCESAHRVCLRSVYHLASNI